VKSAIIIATKHVLLPRQFVQSDRTQSAIRRSKLLFGPGHGLGNPEVLIVRKFFLTLCDKVPQAIPVIEEGQTISL